jgi:AAA family ATP:ADP antiporter
MPAVRYAVAVSPEGVSLAARWIEHPNHGVVEAALESMGGDPARARGLLSPEWISGVTGDPRPERRRLAAVAVRVRGDEDGEALVPLLSDPDGRVAEEACRAAQSLHHRAYIDPLVKRLGDSQVRSAAIEALASYGDRILGTLGDLLDDRALPLAIRRQVPRVLRLIHNQRSVDVLLRCAGERDPALHDVVLRALNRLRENAPNLDFSPALVDAYIRNEVRAWCDFDASLAPFLKRRKLPTASGLLARTLEERKEQTLERLFRLLGLRYRQSEVHAAYRALKRRRGEDRAAALDFLDNILERDHRRLLLRVLDEAPGSSAGLELFGIPPRDAETAIRGLIQSGDAWVASCAIAAAAELKLRTAVPQIEKVARSTGPETGAVARAALIALA